MSSEQDEADGKDQTTKSADSEEPKETSEEYEEDLQTTPKANGLGDGETPDGEEDTSGEQAADTKCRERLLPLRTEIR